MTEQIQNALIAEASRQGTKLLDTDVLRVFPDLTDDLNADDPNAVSEALQKMAERKPSLFKPERKWGDMDPGSDEWRKREEQFRTSLRKSHSVGPNEFSKLDAATLDDEQMRALTRTLQGRGGSYDRSILQRALAEQQKLFGGDAA